MSARKSIINRNTPLDAAERAAYIACIVEGYEEALKLASVLDCRAALLRAEARAVLAAGRKADLENIQGCRREALEKLGESEERQSYIELLLNLAATYCAQKEHREARTIFAAILSSEPGNWHSLAGMALAEAALGNSTEAVRCFERAMAALPDYPYKVSEEEQLDARTKTLDALFEGKAPLETIASLAGKVLAFEEREELPGVPSLGQLPGTLWLAAAKMAASTFDPQQIERCFEVIGEGWGQRVLGACFILRIETLLHEKKSQGEKEAKALQRTAQKLVTIGGFGAECKAVLQHELEEVEKDLEKEAAAKEMRGILGKIEKTDPGVVLRKLFMRFAVVYKKAGPEEAQESGRQEIGRILREMLARPDNIMMAAILSQYIYGIDRELDQVIESCFERALENITTRRAVREVLGRARETADKAVETEGARKELETARPYYDFFAVCLRKLPPVREIFAEISGNPTIEPVSLNSYWRQRMGEQARSAFYLEKSVEEDPENITARLAWSRLLQREGKLDEAEKVLGAGVAENPLVHTRVLALKIERRLVSAERRVEAEAEEITPQQLIALGTQPQAEIVAIAAEARREFSQANYTRYAHNDWVESALKLALLHNLIYDYMAAAGFYDQILALDQDHKEALFGKGSLLVLQGRYAEAEQLISRAILRKGTEAGLHIFFNEIMCSRGGQQLARQNYEKCLLISPDDLRFLLAQAQLLACLDEIEEAKKLFAKALAIHKKAPNKEDGSEFLGPREAFVQYTAATIQTRGGDSSAMDGHRKALRYFKRRPFWSAQIRFNIARRMLEQSQGFERGVAEAARIFRSAPLDPSHNSLVVAPLVRSGEDRLALNCVNYLVSRLGHTGHIHAAPIMDLICLTFREKEVSGEAERTFLCLAEHYRDEELAPKWRFAMQLIKGQLEQLVPGFMGKLPTEVAAILQA